MMKKIWLVEFMTDSKDYAFAAFKNEPTETDIQLYIGGNDWLIQEAEDGTLEWIIEAVDFIENEKE